MAAGWVRLGQPYAEFWQITLREYALITDALVEGKTAELTAQRQLNQELATLITYAYHDPKKMPDFTKTSGKAKRPEMSEAEASKALRAAMIGFYSRSKKD